MTNFAERVASDENDTPERKRVTAEYTKSSLNRYAEHLDRLNLYMSSEGAIVLDAGTGRGASMAAIRLRGGRPIGIELDEELSRTTAELQTRCGMPVTVVRADIQRLPFEDNSCDAALLVDVIEHVPSHQGTISALARMLRPGGLLYVYGPNRLSPSWFRRDPHYQLFGVSWMPRWLGKWYVCSMRKRAPYYSVFQFPIMTRFLGLLDREGFECVDGNHIERERQIEATPKDQLNWRRRYLPNFLYANLNAMFWVLARKR